MGSAASILRKRIIPWGTSSGRTSLDPASGSVHWKQMPDIDAARNAYRLDGTLPESADPASLELRILLDEPLSHRYLSDYAKKTGCLEVFMCWIDIQDFKSIPFESDYRRSRALNIYHKYIQGPPIFTANDENKVDQEQHLTSPLQLPSRILSLADKELFRLHIEVGRNYRDILPDDLFNSLQLKCFIAIFECLFQSFKVSKEYALLNKLLKDKYNTVKADDFEYIKKLGEGGFGLVILCRKKSTDRYYAMKLQTKVGLLDCFIDDPSRIDYEKQAYANCQHPFIASMDYAFQTESLVAMVLTLAEAGDLHSMLKNSPHGRISEDRARIYLAEISLAIHHLHSLGLMYRDLKPHNVLLCADGHVKLVDLGGVVEESGKLLHCPKELSGMKATALVTRHYQNASTLKTSVIKEGNVAFSSAEEINKREKRERDREKARTAGLRRRSSLIAQGSAIADQIPNRRKSIMGTFGYMAPEMVILLSQSEQNGYTRAVDWWSLGITAFKLLTGDRPFVDQNYITRPEPQFDNMLQSGPPPEYLALLQKISFPGYLSEEAKGFIGGLLSPNEQERLGCRKKQGGFAEILRHPFFRDIDWDTLQQKQVEAIHIPSPEESVLSTLSEQMKRQQHYHNSRDNLDEFLRSIGKAQWLEDLPYPEEEVYFETWDYTSSNILKVEFGIANEMEQWNTSIKARKILGGGERMSVSGTTEEKSSSVRSAP